MFKKLLVALDGSSCSSHALELALALARRDDSMIAFCCAVDDDAPAELDDRAQHYVDDALAKAKGAGIVCQGATLYGRPAEAIVEYAQAVDVDTIVMGTHGRSGLKRLFMGSVASAVLRSSSVPVIVVREEARLLSAAPASILVPIDGSECSARALDAAITLAESLSAELVICYVVDLAHAAAMTAGEPELIGAFVDVLEEEGKRVVGQGVQRASAHVSALSRVAQGFPVAQIEKIADEIQPAFIVLGTHGRSGVSRLVMGSVAEGVVRTSKVPVVVVPVGHEESDRIKKRIPTSASGSLA
jgi:nucleotide-binding universal stress UspA family protein